MEIWKDIPWFEWLYQVSSFGNIKSLIRVVTWWNQFWRFKRILPWKTFKKTVWSKWYETVDLCMNWKTRKFRVHRLVAQVFLWLDIDDIQTLVCHKDDIKTNNNKDNLFLWTHKDNMKDMVNKWRAPFKWKYWKCHNRSKKVGQYDLQWNLLSNWESISDAVRATGVSPSWVSMCCLWKWETAWWFIWKYI